MKDLKKWDGTLQGNPEEYAKTMNAYPQPVPPRTMRTASIIVLIFAGALLFFGFNMFRIGSSDTNLAHDLQETGLSGTVTDAQVSIGRGNNRELSTSHAKLVFTGTDGTEHVMETNRFPRFFPDLGTPYGWLEDFPTKGQIVGQAVLYRVGDSPAVLLVNEIPALAEAGWSFPNYLGIVFMVMGTGAGIGGAVSLSRANRRLKENRS